MPCIYIIIHKNKNLCYCGSSISFKARMAYHKFQSNKNNYGLLYNTINENGGIKEWNFYCIKEFYGMSKEDLRKEEDKYIKLIQPNLNKNRAYTSIEQKKEDNRINAQNFRKKNPEYIKDYNKRKKLEKLENEN